MYSTETPEKKIVKVSELPILLEKHRSVIYLYYINIYIKDT